MQQEDISTHQTGPSMIEGSVSLKNPSSQLIEFWSTFHLFPSSFEKNAIGRWYVIALGPYLILLFLSFLVDILWNISSTGNVFSGFPSSFSWTARELTDWIYFSTILALSLISIAFNRWSQRIVPTLKTLLVEGHILSLAQEDLHQRYLDFLEEYQHTLISRKRYFLIMSVLALTLLLTAVPAFLLPPSQAVVDYGQFFSFHPILGFVWLLLRLFWNVLIPLVWSYFVAAGAWIILMTSLFLRKITGHFDLHIQPHHPDKSGGLRLLGNFCLSMVLPLIIGTCFIGAYSISAIHSDGPISTAARVGLLLFALPLTTIAFFIPLWNIHKKMVQIKANYENEFARRMEQVSKRILATLDQHMLEEAKAAKEEMEILQAIDPNTIGYPSWPFDTRILITLFLSQFISFISIIIQIIQFFSH